MGTKKVGSAIKEPLLYGLLVNSMGFAFKGLFWFSSAIWVFFLTHVLHVLGGFYEYLFRVKEEKNKGIGSGFDSIKEDRDGMEMFEFLEGFLFGEREGFGSEFGVLGRSDEEKEGSDEADSLIRTNRYQFYVEDSLSGFIKEPQVHSFTVHEFFAEKSSQDSDGKTESRGGVIFSSDDLGRVDAEVVDDNHLDIEESDDEAEGSDVEDRLISAVRSGGAIGSIEVVGDHDHDHDHDEKARDSSSSSGQEERLGIQREAIGVHDDACERGDVICENRGPISSNEVTDDHKEILEVPDCNSRCDHSSESQSGSPDVEKESIGSNEALIDDVVMVGTSSRSEDEVDKKEEASPVANDVSDEEDIIICFDDASPRQIELPSAEQESVGSNEPVSDRDEMIEASVSRSSSEEKFETLERAAFVQDDLSERESATSLSHSFWGVLQYFDEGRIISEYHEVSFDSKQETTSSAVDFLGANEDHDSGVLSDISAGEVSKPDTPPVIIGEKRSHYDAEDSPVSEESEENNHDEYEEDSTSKVLESRESSKEHHELEGEETSSFDRDSDDEMEDDILLAYKGRMRQTGNGRWMHRVHVLPTILEESESLRLDEDMKPLRIDSKNEHKDRMDEIQLFYKGYLDKMRKLDIIGHQTMNSIGLVQFKNQDQLAAKRKLSAPAVVKSLLPHKIRRQDGDPLKMLMREWQRDLELVYVGQLCLSWEILKWQYGKALDLQGYDSFGSRQYNVAAGEFQQFHVLVQRFTEDQPFQGPRVQYYLRSRCIQCNLLQVPVIKEDAKNGRRGGADDKITLTRLVEIVDESMRAFWEFLHEDKGEATSTLKGIIGSNPDLLDPSDMALLSDIRASLQKKERRLKDLIKSGNCIVKKFQKHKNRRLSHDMFLAQVELRLVSRVISMSRLTTDQLLWCHKKLGKINFVGGQALVDSSFSLFPC